jgi:hypothetical protein
VVEDITDVLAVVVGDNSAGVAVVLETVTEVVAVVMVDIKKLVSVVEDIKNVEAGVVEDMT